MSETGMCGECGIQLADHESIFPCVLRAPGGARIVIPTPAAPVDEEAVAWMSKAGDIVVTAREKDSWRNQYAKDAMCVPLYARRPVPSEPTREGLAEWEPFVRELAQTRNPRLHELADLLAAMKPRTVTYAHDCGCETCGDHTLPRPRAEVTVTEEMLAAGHIASQHITDQYGSTEFVPSDVVQRILTAALAASTGGG